MSSDSLAYVDRAELRLRLSEWMETIPQDGAPGIRLAMVRLYHKGSRIPCGNYRIDHGTTKANDLAERIALTAQSDVKHKRNAGQQTYEVHAFFGEEMHPREAYKFPLEYVDDDEEVASDGGSGGNVGTARAAVRLAKEGMAFGAKLAKVAAKQTGDTLQGALNIIAQQADQILRLETKCTSLFEQLQDAEDRKQERINTEIRAKAWADTIREGAQLCKVMIPIVVNRIRGEKLLPEVGHPLLEQFRMLYAELDQEAIAGIMMATANKPRAQMLLGELMTLVEDERVTQIAKAGIVQQAIATNPTNGQNPPKVAAGAGASP